MNTKKLLLEQIQSANGIIHEEGDDNKSDDI